MNNFCSIKQRVVSFFSSALAFTVLSACTAMPPANDQDEKNAVAGCEATTTQNYTGYIQPGWNQSTPKSMVVGSDPQYPATLDSNGHLYENRALSNQRLSQVFSDIANYRVKSNTFVPFFINGDLTHFGHGHERETTQKLFRGLSGGPGGPLFFPGLGNHDYDQNVGECANNGCARDSVCDVLQWEMQIPGLRSIDYHYAKPEHRGSLSYSFDIGRMHFIQLHNGPLYSVYFETGNHITSPKRKFNIRDSLSWLESDLRDARARGQYIFINLHKRNTWPSGDVARFKAMVNNYLVSAVFAGHVHGELGLVPYEWEIERYGLVPVFQSGALLNKSYLIVEFEPDVTADLGAAKVYKVAPGKSNAQKEIVSGVLLRGERKNFPPVTLRTRW
ncbi:metallophosphoesterase family protein [Pseudomonas huaxiensis]|uniref:metallophosphoesterase family protein n=1 Tax=Pseudomonas huaxiensis TaxID=2213017 RepID=UPI000DA6B156|nr:metallophosphoesterase [Pseudomonas huaxiensis]